MHHAQTTKQKIKLFLFIMFPILITQVGYNAMGLFDTIMSGQYATDDLAAVAIGSNLWMPIFVAINGILLAITPIISQLVGAGKKDDIASTVMQALYLALCISIAIIVIGSVALEPILNIMKLDPSVHAIAKHYLIGLSFGIIPLFLSCVVRNFFDAQGHTTITMFIVLIAVPFNILLNWMLIYGKFGFPELGGAGSGYATAATYWFILVLSVLMTFVIKPMRVHSLFRNWPKVSLKTWKTQLSIGIPIGLSVFFEASIFSMVTLFMGSMFEKTTVAAHQAAASWSGMMFMIPLSISMALTILVGYEAGAGRAAHAKIYSRIGVLSALTVIGTLAIILFFNRDIVASWFTKENEVALLAQQFLIFVIFFQLSDSAQATLQGALRGYKDVTIPFIIALTSYWFIGIPLGYSLAAYTFLGPYGFWVGIIAGLSCAAIGFLIRLRYIQRINSIKIKNTKNAAAI